MISIARVPHSQQRYNTLGDWYYDSDGNLFIIVSKLGSTDMESCLIIHELTEALLCAGHGISQPVVDKFDLGLGSTLDEPGDDPRAPYHLEHMYASVAERQLALALDISWPAYEARCDEVSRSYPSK